MNNKELKSLDEALDYLNEGKLLDKLKAKFKLGKKPDKKAPIKNKEQNKAPEYTEEQIAQGKEDYKKLIEGLKKGLDAVKKHERFKSACAEGVKELREDWDYEVKDGFIPHFTIDDSLSAHVWDDVIIEVIDDSQEVAIVYSWILKDIVSSFKAIDHDAWSKYSYSYGDGDEGCIYAIHK